MAENETGGYQPNCDPITLDEIVAAVAKIAWPDSQGVDVNAAKVGIKKTISQLNCRCEAIPTQRPKTCRECRFCSNLDTALLFAFCNYQPPQNGPDGEQTYCKVDLDMSACHLGELRDEPWVTVGDDRVHTPTPKVEPPT